MWDTWSRACAPHVYHLQERKPHVVRELPSLSYSLGLTVVSPSSCCFQVEIIQVSTPLNPMMFCCQDNMGSTGECSSTHIILCKYFTEFSWKLCDMNIPLQNWFLLLKVESSFLCALYWSWDSSSGSSKDPGNSLYKPRKCRWVPSCCRTCVSVCFPRRKNTQEIDGVCFCCPLLWWLRYRSRVWAIG